MNNDLSEQIPMTIRKMLYPAPLMHWMEGMTQAERVGRIKRSNWSTLRYCLRQFVISQLPSFPTGTKTTVIPMDDEIVVQLHNDNADRIICVTYPDWLLDFLDEDENFELMVPECQEKVGEVIQRIYEWCMTHPPYDLLVKS